MGSSYWSSKEQAESVASTKKAQGHKGVSVSYVSEKIPWRRYKVVWGSKRKDR